MTAWKASVSRTVACAALLLSGSAIAQQQVGSPPISPPLKPIEQGVEDVNPLSASLRDMQVDLRLPSGFSNVYRVPGQEGVFMRGSGGLYAVFPQSQYVPTRQGMLVQVPAGTVYHIGLPQPVVAEPEESLEWPAVDGRMRHQLPDRRETFIDDMVVESIVVDGATPPNVAAATTGPSVDRTVATDETYRVQRITSHLARAAAAQSQHHH